MSRDNLHQIIDQLPEHELELVTQLLEQIQQHAAHPGNESNNGDAMDDEDEGEEIEAALEWHFHLELTHPDGLEVHGDLADDLMQRIVAWSEEKGLEVSGEVVAMVDEDDEEEPGPMH